MKKIILLGFIAVFLFNCKSQINNKKDPSRILNIALEIFEKENINNRDNFIILSSMRIKDTVFYKNGKYGIGVTVMNSNLTYGLNYKRLYSYNGIPVISKDSLKIFKSLLTPIPYQNLNKSHIKELNYDPFNITLIFNERNELIYTFPDQYEDCFKKL